MRIPDNKIEEGMILCQKNVDRLLRDVSILHRNGSYGHALSSAMFAYDEYGKKLLLYSFQVPDVADKEEVFKLIFSSHRVKYLAISAFFHRLAKRIDEVDEQESNIETLAIDAFAMILQAERGRGLYVRYDDKTNQWLDPNPDNQKGQALDYAKRLKGLISLIEPLPSIPFKKGVPYSKGKSSNVKG